MNKLFVSLVSIILIGYTYAGAWNGETIGYIQKNGKLIKQEVDSYFYGNMNGGGFGHSFNDGTSISYSCGNNDEECSVLINDKVAIGVKIVKGVPKDYSCFKNPKKKDTIYCIREM